MRVILNLDGSSLYNTLKLSSLQECIKESENVLFSFSFSFLIKNTINNTSFQKRICRTHKIIQRHFQLCSHLNRRFYFYFFISSNDRVVNTHELAYLVLRYFLSFLTSVRLLPKLFDFINVWKSNS